MKVLLTLSLTFFFWISVHGQSVWTKYKMNSSLIEMKSGNQGQLKLIDSVWQIAKSTSQSKIIRTDDGIEVLNFCTCKLKGDTLKVTAFELSNKGATPQLSVFKNKFKATTVFYSGADHDHSEKYELHIASATQSMQLNKSTMTKGTQLIGYLDIRSKSFQHHDLNSAVEFRGPFQCIIE